MLCVYLVEKSSIGQASKVVAVASPPPRVRLSTAEMVVDVRPVANSVEVARLKRDQSKAVMMPLLVALGLGGS